MSSADTLNFGPQWLRDLSEGSASSSSSALGQTAQALSKFKLAENRYGREEMLALFVEEPEVPDELHRAPSLVSEIVQIPLALRATAEHSQPQLNSSFRSRGVSTGSRGRSITSRGRGRGRGSAWADHDDGPLRRPPLRRSESEDWRSDSLRGKGDGAEDIINGLKEWRVSGHRGGADFWKDAWREKSEDGGDQRYSRSRSLSLKDHEDGDHLWQDNKMNGVHVKQSDNVNSTGKNEQQKGHEVKNSTQEEGVINSGTTGDQYPVDSGGSDKQSKPLEALHEHEEETINGDKKGSPELSLPETKLQLGQHKDPLEDIYNKLSRPDPQEQQPDVPTLATSGQFHFLNSDVMTAKKSNPPQMPPVPPEPVSSNSPMAQLQALATTWYYKDPQGDVQGPFSSSQMLEWFNAGYFTMGLLVKRACDQEFTPLGELIKRWGQIPFTSSAPKSAFTTASPAVDPMSTSQVQYTKPIQHPMQTSSQAPIKRMPSVNDIQSILEKLLENPEFCRLSPQEQQVVVAQYAEQLKRQSLLSTAKPVPSFADPNPLLGDTGQASIFQSEAILRQKMLEEARRKEEEEIRKIQKQQEEQKELLRRQEEEFRKKKEFLMLEEQRIKQLQLEAQQKKEQLQREIEEDERRKKLQEMQEMERRKREEEERLQQERELQRRLAEQRRLEEEEEKRKREEEMRRMKEEARKAEEMLRLEMYREEQRILEEKRRQEQRDREAMEAERQMREAEMQKREAARLQIEREEEAAKLALKKQREKQMQAQHVPLPQQSRWGQIQTAPVKNESLSLVEIQKLESQVEKARAEEEARMAREQRTQPPKQRSGWAANRGVSAGLSLVDIQREEAKQMSITKHTTVNTNKPEISKPSSFGSSWSKPPKIQPDPPKQNKAQSSFWDQVVEENPPKKSSVVKQTPVGQSQPNQTKQKKGPKQKGKGNDEQQVKAIFQQQISKDRFTDWCENYLRKMNVGSIDVPTFVNFLRDVESPHEVQEYVQSYLGESKSARDFTTLFLEERAKLSRPHDSSLASNKPRSAASRDTDGFEVVTSNAKRKKKLRKSQKVDPSILGFSVNAASDRVNMGEIETAHD